MTTLRHEIRIEVPVEKVWAALFDLAAVERYNPMVASARWLGERREGVGAGRHCELVPRGWVEERVWEWTPTSAIGLEVAKSDWPLVFMKWRTRLLADGAATVVSQEMSYRLKFGPLGPLGALLDALVMRKKLDASVGEVFAGLKRYLEGAQRT